MRALELQVATDVTNAALQVESGLKRYEAAVVARDLAQTRLSAEQSRFEVGLSTNFFVVQAQRDLATAQNAELRALLDYRRALVDFARVQEAPAQRGAGITRDSSRRRQASDARRRRDGRSDGHEKDCDWRWSRSRVLAARRVVFRAAAMPTPRPLVRAARRAERAGAAAAADGGGGGAGGFGGGQFGRPPMTVELGKATRALRSSRRSPSSAT